MSYQRIRQKCQNLPTGLTVRYPLNLERDLHEPYSADKSARHGYRNPDLGKLHTLHLLRLQL